jgi:AcrR family transcriptional regulator
MPTTSCSSPVRDHHPIAADSVGAGKEVDAVPRVKLRTAELRDHVLAVALGALAEDGTSSFTTKRIADAANTSVPAVYELFGDKAGLVRGMFFDGFTQLRDRFDQLIETDDPVADVTSTFQAFRQFVRDRPALVQVMFSRPFAEFAPSRADLLAGASTRQFVERGVARCVEAGVIEGDPNDIAHVLLSVAEGLAQREIAGTLGGTTEALNRRWDLAVSAILTGLRQTLV